LQVKSQSQIKTNYEQSTSIVTDRYKTGVAGASWKDDALAGQDLYVARMADPNVLARRTAGINEVSDDEWRNNTITKGSGVIAARMKAASADQASGFEPYRAILQNMTLPAKTTDPAQNVINRVVPIAVAFAEQKNRNP
jgi:hypothetical protein